MPVISRVVSILLRIGELAFAAVVAGIVGSYLHAYDQAHAWPQARFIYTEVVAGISMILALFWLLPFTATVINWPGDLIMFILWIVAFGLLVNVSLLLSPYECVSFQKRLTNRVPTVD
jgi:Membrane-associating domain